MSYSWIDSFMEIFGFKRAENCVECYDNIVRYVHRTAPKEKPKRKKLKWPSYKTRIVIRDMMKKKKFYKSEMLMYISMSLANEVLKRYKEDGKIAYNQATGAWGRIKKIKS